MRKSLIFSLTTLVLLAGSNLYAETFSIGGYANVWVPLSHSDAKQELQTSATSEVDFEKTSENRKTTVRVDLDLPGAGGKSSVAAALEQAKVIQGLGHGLSLTAGAFNTPFGFEAQDAPDKLEFSNGQLFALRPANLAGVMGSLAGGPVEVDLFIANDFRGQATTPTGYDNSFGGRLGLTAAKVGVEVGYLTSERTKTSPVPTGNGNLLNLVLTASPMEHTDVAFELLSDDNNDGWGLTAHHMHGKHGLTARYDSVENTPAKSEATSLTVNLSCQMMEAVTTNLEWKTTDPGGTSKSVDHIVLQWVAPF